MRGASDPQLLALCGVEGHEGVHGGYERDLYGCKPRSGRVRIGSLRAEVGLEVSPCRTELAPQLGRAERLFRLPRRDTQDHLHDQSDRKSQR